MKAIAVFPHDRQIRIVDEQEPEVTRATDVKVRVLEVGICGTDREIASFQYGSPPPGCDYLVIGHEALGEVVEVGVKTRRVRVGDLVSMVVRRPCDSPSCIACRSGRPDFCYTGEYTERGIKGRHGFMTERVVDDEQYMVPVPQRLRDVAVLAEPLSIAEKALEQVEQVQQRLPWGWPGFGQDSPYENKAVVLGMGPVGLLGAMALTVRGFRVFGYSAEEAGHPKARLLEAIGGRYTSARDRSLADFAASVGNIDLVYEAAGAAQPSFDLLKHLGANGVFVFTGVPGHKGSFEMAGAEIMRDMVLRNQIAFGTVNASRQAFEAAIDDLENFMDHWPEIVPQLITTRAPVAEFHDLLTGKPNGIKDVIAVAERAAGRHLDERLAAA